MATYYVDSQAIVNGSGSITSPYNKLSSIPILNAGDFVYLKRDSIFRETFKPVGNTFASSNKIIIDQYGSGNNPPIIRGSDILDNNQFILTPGTTGIYEVVYNYEGSGTAPTHPTALYINDKVAFIGTAIALSGAAPTDLELGHKEWYYDKGTKKLYVGCNTPISASGWVIDVVKRQFGINVNSATNHFSWCDFKNIIVDRCDNYALVIFDIASDGLTFDSCKFINSYQGIKTYSKTTNINNCVLSNLKQGIYQLTTSSVLNVTNTLIENCYYRGIENNSSYTNQVLNIDGCTFAGAHIVNSNPTVLATITNSIFVACPLAGTEPPIYNTISLNAGAYIKISYNIFSGNGLATGDSSGTYQGSYLWTNSPSAKAVTDLGNNVVGFGDFKHLQPVNFIISLDQWETISDGYAGWHKIFLDMVKSYNNPEWSGISAALHATQNYTATDWSNVREFVASGGEVMGHTRNHINVALDHAFLVKYTGAAASATMTINNATSALTLIEDGVIKANITNFQNYTTNALTSAITGTPSWSVSADASLGYPNSTILNDGTLTVGSTYIPVPLNVSKYLNYEISGNKTDIESNVPTTVKTFVYPNGNWNTHHTIGDYLKNYGFIGARTITPPNGSIIGWDSPEFKYRSWWDTPNNTRLFDMRAQDEASRFYISGLVCHYNASAYSNGTYDITFDGAYPPFPLSTNPYPLTNVGCSAAISPSASVHQGKASIKFNVAATGQYLYRSTGWDRASYKDDTNIGDWQWGAYIYPTQLPSAGNKATILYHASSGNNYNDDYHMLYIDDAGKVKYDMYIGGSLIVSLASSAISLNTPYSVLVRQMYSQGVNKIELYVTNGKYSKTIVDYKELPLNTYPHALNRGQLGASYINGIVGNYYFGYMDDVHITTKTAQITKGIIESAAIVNSPVIMYGHISPPPDVYKTILDVASNYRSSTVSVLPYGSFVQKIKNYASSGGFDTRSDLLWRGERVEFTIPDFAENNYQPLGGSLADKAGYNRAYIGAYIPNSDSTPPNITTFELVDDLGNPISNPSPGQLSNIKFMLNATDAGTGMIGGKAGYFVLGSELSNITTYPTSANFIDPTKYVYGDNFILNNPSLYTGFTTYGTKYLYAWARDYAGNTSDAYKLGPFTLTQVVPYVTGFSIGTPNYLNVTVSVSGNTGSFPNLKYLVTESSATPNISDSWSTSGNYLFTASGSGTKTLYPWVMSIDYQISSLYSNPITATFTQQDSIAPTINSFELGTVTNLTVPVTAFTATDNVTPSNQLYYGITTVNNPTTAVWWYGSPPTYYSVSSTGTYTFYPWAKDSSGNISALSAQAKTVTFNTRDSNPPVVVNFTLPVSSNKLNFNISLSAVDDNIINGYIVSDSITTKPSPNNINWQTTKPVSAIVTTSLTNGNGNIVFYAWAKDDSSNVSIATQSSTASIYIDVSTKPVIRYLTIPNNIDSRIDVPITRFTADDDSGIIAYYLSDDINVNPNTDPSKWINISPTATFDGSGIKYTFTNTGTRTLRAWVKNSYKISDPLDSNPINITSYVTQDQLAQLKDQILNTPLSESYGDIGQPITLIQAIYMILSLLSQKAIDGNNLIVNKATQSDQTAMVFELNNINNPTSIKRVQ